MRLRRYAPSRPLGTAGDRDAGARRGVSTMSGTTPSGTSPRRCHQAPPIDHRRGRRLRFPHVNQATVFACQYARLVWLLLNDARNIEEQKDALRAARTALADGSVTIARRMRRLFANGKALPDTFAAAPELGAQLVAHGVRVIAIDAGAPPAEMLATARLLAANGAAGDGGRDAHAKLSAMKNTGMKFAFEDESLAPALNDMLDKVAKPLTVPTGLRVPDEALSPVGVTDESGMWQHFKAASVPDEDAQALFSRIDKCRTTAEVARLVDDLSMLAEQAARDGKSHVLAIVCCGFARRETMAEHTRNRPTFAGGLRRLLRGPHLRAIAKLLPRKREMAEDLELVLRRSGEDGADAMIELMAEEPLATDRRVFLETLPRLQAGIPTLVHMLGDARWFVVRNAADLLGEMRVTSAETALLPLLQHADERVRRSIANALINIGSTSGFRAVCDMLDADSPKTRAQAAAALASSRDERSTVELRNALEEEPDTEVQYALLAALGKIATAAAVDQLIRAAEPKRRLLERKSTAFRVAAVEALGEARTPAALAALALLREDKEREVRDAATLAYQHANRVASE